MKTQTENKCDGFGCLERARELAVGSQFHAHSLLALCLLALQHAPRRYQTAPTNCPTIEPFACLDARDRLSGSEERGRFSSSIIENRRSVHFAHLLVLLGSALLPEEDGLAVLVLLQGSDDTVAWVHGNVDHLAIRFFFLLNFLNDNPSALAVDSLHLTLASLEWSAHDLDRVTLAHWHRADIVLVSQILGEVRRHHDSANTAGRCEVCLP